ncbi:hypothetical protein FY528_15090 [Hymenobacter lutimineralis]|uniref:DUF3575 domain-containing protein n=1 Tax=Hymenobacter lutimineralis TaxID=2606448 RepID=A0A5D6UWV4_9BACT|nr:MULTISPECIES: hypothetical protein [Hymenobacter]QIX60507.1 hypothetical protein HER32_04625 [Hymenobacter sp. BT18]TYZ07388.1 hypothetical protein FY528_15090 [Hymenobacter lutimineralis]
MKVLLGSSLLWVLWAGGAGPAAAETPPDTSRVRQSHRRVVFQFDQRYSLLNGGIVGINGLKAGIEWRGRLRTGLGIYLLSDGVPTDVALPSYLPPGTRDELRFRYVAAYGEYVVVGTPRWELSTPTQLGIGRYYARYEKPDGQVERTPKQLIYILEPSVAGHVRIFRWVGLGAGGGYRQMLFQDNALESELNGPIFFGRVKLFLGDLYKIVRGRQRLFSQQGL